MKSGLEISGLRSPKVDTPDEPLGRVKIRTLQGPISPRVFQRIESRRSRA